MYSGTLLAFHVIQYKSYTYINMTMFQKRRFFQTFIHSKCEDQNSRDENKCCFKVPRITTNEYLGRSKMSWKGRKKSSLKGHFSGRAPSLWQPFCLLEFRSKNSGLPPDLEGSSWFPAVFLFTSNHYDPARAAASCNKNFFQSENFEIVKLKDLHLGYRLVKKNFFLGRLEPSKEAGSPLLFQSHFSRIFMEIFW